MWKRENGRAMLFSCFQKKEVINIRNCQKIGNVVDMEFDECTGQIQKIVISEGFHFCRLFEGNSDIVICYRDIKQIGPYIILVDLCCNT